MEDSQQQELMFKLSMLKQQSQQLQEQIYSIEKASIEINNLKVDLENLIGSKDKEVLASIGKGIFIKAKLDSEDLLVDIGNKNLVKKSIPDTQKIIGQQISNLKEISKDLEENLIKIHEEINGLISKS